MRTFLFLVLCSAVCCYTVVPSPAQAQVPVTINMSAIRSIESGGDPAAFNSRTRCYGLYQISEICLKEYNEYHSTGYASRDLFDPQLNAEIALWYFGRIADMLDHYDVPVQENMLIAAYNWGIGNVVAWYRAGAEVRALPQQTREYIEKYRLLAAASD